MSSFKYICVTVWTFDLLKNILSSSLNAKRVAGIGTTGRFSKFQTESILSETAASTKCTHLTHTHFQCHYQNTDSPLPPHLCQNALGTDLSPDP